MTSVTYRFSSSGCCWTLAIFLLATGESSSSGQQRIAQLREGGPPKLSESDLQLVKLGMKKKEVARVLGCRPGNYATRSFVYYSTSDDKWEGSKEEWSGDWGKIIVGYDENGVVGFKTFMENSGVSKAPETIAQRIYRAIRDAFLPKVRSGK
jgi:hypothetical protein